MGGTCCVCGRTLADAEVLYTPDARIVCAGCFEGVKVAGASGGGGGLVLPGIALAVAAIPFLVSQASSSSETVNGVVTKFVYRDWIAIGCGVIGALLGLAATMIALRAPRKAKAIALGAAALVLGGLQIARGFGVFATPGSAAAERSELAITTTTLAEPVAAAPTAEICADARACLELGTKLEGKGQDLQQLAAFERACELSDGEGCESAAFVIDRGRAGPRDRARVAKLLDKGCSLGSATACNDLGMAYQDGAGVAADPAKAGELFAKAFELFAKACDNDPDGSNAVACDTAGERAMDGTGVTADPARGRAYLEKACSRDPKTCLDFGVALEKGLGGAKDLAGARKAFEKACRSGDTSACTQLKNLTKGSR